MSETAGARKVRVVRMKDFHPPLTRVQKIAAALNSKKRVTAAALADELEVTRRTITRDFEFMRDQLNLPVEADRYGLFFSEPVNLCQVCGRRKRLQKGSS